jgi:hypothetical protein
MYYLKKSLQQCRVKEYLKNGKFFDLHLQRWKKIKHENVFFPGMGSGLHLRTSTVKLTDAGVTISMQFLTFPLNRLEVQ